MSNDLPSNARLWQVTVTKKETVYALACSEDEAADAALRQVHLPGLVEVDAEMVEPDEVPEYDQEDSIVVQAGTQTARWAAEQLYWPTVQDAIDTLG